MEIVQKRMEMMTGEIEQMVRTKIFTYEECRTILKKRREFEYSINGIKKNLPDFLDYIEYEMQLLKLIRLQRNSKKIGEKIGCIEHKIMNKIKGLYEVIMKRFPDNTTIYLAYLKFCKQANYINAASSAVSNMIKHHSHKVEIWQVAARWHANDRNDISTALKILLKGIAKHKTSKLLYTEMIQLEIQNTLCKSAEEESVTDNTRLSYQQKLCLEKLEIYFNEIVNHINDCEYFIEMLQYLEEYDFTESVQIYIIKYIVEKYSSKAVTWNMLAQRDRDGCIERYKEGLKKVVDSEKELLYSLYINCLLDVRRENPTIANVLETNALIEAFESASAENFLSEMLYLQWLELTDSDERLRIMEIALSKYPDSLELWKFSLRNSLQSENRENIQKTFTQGVQKLRERALPLWTAFIRYLILNSDDNTIELVYKDGIKQPAEVSDILKPHYVEWLVATKSPTYAREQYLILAAQKPYCKELHNTMFKLETTELEMDCNICDKIHEFTCEQFGKEDVEVWLNRMQYYTDFKKEEFSKDRLFQTYQAAQKALPPVLFSDFKDRYSAMTCKSSK